MSAEVSPKSPASIAPPKPHLFAFFGLVVAFSIPLWIAGQLTGWQLVPGLPLAATGAFCPALAAAILTLWESGRKGLKTLLSRAGDYRRVRDKRWYLVGVLLIPAILLITWLATPIFGLPLPSPEFAPLETAFLAVAFFVAAEGEELGWSAYATDPMQARWGSLEASLLLGTFWAGWHVIPYFQAGHTPSWVLWQCIGTVALRVIMVWGYNGSGKSVFVLVLMHMMINVGEFPFPNYTMAYNPEISGVLFVLVAAGIVMFFGRRTPTPGSGRPHPPA
jgi:hypothetical protein